MKAPAGKGTWRYPEELLREIAAAPGYASDVAGRFNVHRDTVKRARELYSEFNFTTATTECNSVNAVANGG